jgi:hypothetical protein
MKPHKIFKNNSNPLRKKTRIITELKEPKVPLRFFKMIHPPQRMEMTWGNISIEDQIVHQQNLSSD